MGRRFVFVVLETPGQFRPFNGNLENQKRGGIRGNSAGGAPEFPGIGQEATMSKVAQESKIRPTHMGVAGGAPVCLLCFF